MEYRLWFLPVEFDHFLTTFIEFDIMIYETFIIISFLFCDRIVANDVRICDALKCLTFRTFRILLHATPILNINSLSI
jgi:hypothetical protein